MLETAYSAGPWWRMLRGWSSKATAVMPQEKSSARDETPSAQLVVAGPPLLIWIKARHSGIGCIGRTVRLVTSPSQWNYF